MLCHLCGERDATWWLDVVEGNRVRTERAWCQECYDAEHPQEAAEWRERAAALGLGGEWGAASPGVTAEESRGFAKMQGDLRRVARNMSAEGFAEYGGFWAARLVDWSARTGKALPEAPRAFVERLRGSGSRPAV